jgi:nucleotide-binding universal stress UspA family protein
VTNPITSILVPLDFSETSYAALHYAIDLGRALGARLFLLHVPGETGEHFEANFPIGEFTTAGRERLTNILAPEEIEHLRPEYALRIGTPVEEIIRYADARAVDMIIMGTNGRSGVAHLLMGSVAEQVVRRAPCPVLLVRHPTRSVRARRAALAASTSV